MIGISDGRVVVYKHSGKVTLPSNVINGMTPKTALKLKDTEYYQIGPSGDYMQGQ